MVALATVDQVAAVLQIDLTPDDASAQFWLMFASSGVRTYTGQDITQKLGDVELGTPLRGVLSLRQRPVGQVSLVETLGRDGVTWTVRDPATWRLSARNGTITPVGLGWTDSWPASEESWRVTYDHGYPTVPDDISGVTAAVAARMYTTPVAVSSERLGQRQTSYKPEDLFTPMELLILGGYREARMS